MNDSISFSTTTSPDIEPGIPTGETTIETIENKMACLEIEGKHETEEDEETDSDSDEEETKSPPEEKKIEVKMPEDGFVVKDGHGCEVRLYKYQVEHFVRLVEIFQKTRIAIDCSRMGLGKTPVGCAIAIELSFPHIVVICPATVKSVWEKWMKVVGLAKDKRTSVDIISYDALRGKRTHQEIQTFKHGLLTRKGHHFSVTKKWKKLAEDGVFLICDEGHKLKNKGSSQRKACATLIRHISQQSRVLITSGTLFDKREHAINLMQTIGHIKSRKLYEMVQGEFQLKGAQELLDKAKYFDAEKTHTFEQEKGPFTRHNIRKLCYELFMEIIKPSICSAMIDPDIDQQIKLDGRNAFYWIQDKEERKKLNDHVKAVYVCLAYDEERDEVNANMTDVLKALNYQLHQLEIAEIPLFTRIMKKTLETNKSSHVVMFVNYKETYETLMENLREYKPLLLCGDTKMDQRKYIIEKFNKPSNEHRVLISQIQVGSMGIDLQDSTGEFPRVEYLSPSYNFILIVQALRRCARKGGIGKVVGRIIYPLVNTSLCSVLTALLRKRGVLEELLRGLSDDKFDYFNPYFEPFPIITENIRLDADKKEKELYDQYCLKVKKLLDPKSFEKNETK